MVEDPPVTATATATATAATGRPRRIMLRWDQYGVRIREDHMRMKHWKRIAGLLLGLLFATEAAAQPVVPGFAVDIYAPVSDPVTISFAPNGDLYVGRDLLGSGGSPAAATIIHRVLAGGAIVEEFGAEIEDPDSVLFDPTGLIAPLPNSVLVGSQLDSVTGKISAISPAGAVSTLIGPTTTFVNPSDFAFDGTGRLLFTDFQNNQVKFTTGGTPSVLFTVSTNLSGIAYDPVSDRVYTSDVAGTIRAHTSSGAVIDAAFSTGRGIAVANDLLGFGTAVYSVDNGSGELLRTDLAGNSQVVGTGFVSVFDLAFSPDGDLFASEFDNDRIIRITPSSVPALSIRGLSVLVSLLISLPFITRSVGLASARARLRARGTARHSS